MICEFSINSNLPNTFILKVSSLKSVTSESGVKNPIQRTTFYLQRTSGARVMTCSDAVNTRVGDGLGTVSDAVNTRVGDGLGTLKTHLGTIWSSLGEPVPPKKFRGNQFPRPTLYDFLFPNSKNPSSAAWLGKNLNGFAISSGSLAGGRGVRAPPP